MAFDVGGGGGSFSDINVTPLVDVMLVLLVIFMVTATLLKPPNQTERHSDTEAPVTRDNPNVIDLNNTNEIILFIDANLRVYIGDETITDCSAAVAAPSVQAFLPCLAEIGTKLGQNAKLAHDHEIYVLADTHIPYGFVAGTLAQIRNAGVDRVGMITNPDYLTEAERRRLQH
jgi:biopolymer transport protein TolR